jgi:hypothetical protein
MENQEQERTRDDLLLRPAKFVRRWTVASGFRNGPGHYLEFIILFQSSIILGPMVRLVVTFFIVVVVFIRLGE